MMTTKRTLLVVEDDQVLNKLYKIHCEEVLKELPHIEGKVEQAFDYDQAREILNAQPVDFISVDIALSQEEEGITDQQRVQREVGGMALLKELEEAQRQPLTVIVSGETLLSYAIDAYRKYGILVFYQKDRFNVEEYKHAIKAALWYLDAAELSEKPEIEAALASWKRALAAAEIAGIKEHQFPEDIGHKIEARWTHAVTGLPTSRWTEEKLTDRVVERHDWGLIRLSIDGFRKFTTVFASQEQAILSFTANLLKRAGDRFQNQGFFVGHLGHLEQIPEPSFVIILDTQQMEQAAALSDWLKSEFEKKEGLFSPAFEDKASRQKLALNVDTSILTGSDYFFEDLHRLLDTLGST